MSDIVDRLGHDNPWLLVTPQELKREIECLRQRVEELETEAKKYEHEIGWLRLKVAGFPKAQPIAWYRGTGLSDTDTDIVWQIEKPNYPHDWKLLYTAPKSEGKK